MCKPQQLTGRCRQLLGRLTFHGLPSPVREHTLTGQQAPWSPPHCGFLLRLREQWKENGCCPPSVEQRRAVAKYTIHHYKILSQYLQEVDAWQNQIYYVNLDRNKFLKTDCFWKKSTFFLYTTCQDLQTILDHTGNIFKDVGLKLMPLGPVSMF